LRRACHPGLWALPNRSVARMKRSANPGAAQAAWHCPRISLRGWASIRSQVKGVEICSPSQVLMRRKILSAALCRQHREKVFYKLDSAPNTCSASTLHPGYGNTMAGSVAMSFTFQLTLAAESDTARLSFRHGASHESSKSIEGARRARGLPGLHHHGLCRRRRPLELRGRAGTCQMGRPRRRQQGLLARRAAIADQYRVPHQVAAPGAETFMGQDRRYHRQQRPPSSSISPKAQR